MLLQVIIASTRPGRVGPTVAEWFVKRAKDHGAFEVETVDLAEVALPLFDEPSTRGWATISMTTHGAGARSSIAPMLTCS